MSSQAKPLSEYHPFDPAVIAQPLEFDRRLLDEAPVYRDPNTKLVLVSSYERVMEVLKRHEEFSSQFGQAMGGSGSERRGPSEIEEIMQEGYPAVNTMLTADPPEHKRFRSLVNKAFTPRRVSGIEAEMVKISEALVDAFVGRGRFHALENYGIPIPLMVIADQLGVPREDLPKFRHWTEGFVAQLGGLASSEEQIEAARLIVEYQHYFAARLEEARADPREDIISDLVRARIEGERPLDTAESLSIIQQLLVAGHETTASTIAAGLLLMIEHPEQQRALRADESLLAGAIEEIIRLASPTQNMWRVTTRECELGGVELRKGEFVFIRFGASNRDPEKFPEPDVFDIQRENAADHLAFGHGIHFCIGAMLARKEMEVAYRTLFARVDGLRLSPGQEIRHKPSMLLRALDDFEIEFDLR